MKVFCPGPHTNTKAQCFKKEFLAPWADDQTLCIQAGVCSASIFESFQLLCVCVGGGGCEAEAGSQKLT